jgi:pimeloyl-ACP methyl ester carboxylesterase
MRFTAARLGLLRPHPAQPALPRRRRHGTAAVLSLCAGLLLASSGCSYVGTWAKQNYYAFQFRHSPRQRTSKHMLDRETFFVFGRVLGRDVAADVPVAVLAVSHEPIVGEIVDVSRSVRGGSYYGLNLPAGSYQLVGVADLNGDGFYAEDEMFALRRLQLDATAAEKVVSGFDLGERRTPRAPQPPFRIAVESKPDPSPSLFYPKGTIRRLDDPIFSPEMASLGLYEPAAFMEAAPMTFYALDEELAYRVPVIFVHGIGGSARDFEEIIRHLDTRRYRAWFYHYPSGASLEQLSGMFYEVFLSGNTIPRLDTPVVIVAHSMGGLVVRDALNRWRGTPHELAIGAVVTIASPLGGHPAAARSAHAPVAIPSWQDLDPQSGFIRKLHRNPLPAGLRYHLFYTFGDPRTLKLGQPGYGVVPLASQLPAASQREATEQFGFNCSHTGVLHDPAAITATVSAIEQVKSRYPADHLSQFDRGGYDLDLPASEFTAVERYVVKSIGRYVDALVSGEIAPIDELQRQFVDEYHGRRPVDSPLTQLWLKLNRFAPDRARLQ